MRLLSFLLFLLSISPAFGQKPKGPVTYDLNEAVAKKLVGLDIAGMGGYSKASLKLVFKNLSGRYMRVRIPLGQLLMPADSAQQTLVNSNEQLVSLSAKTPATVMLDTYCTEAGDLSPSAGAVFAVGALAPEKLCRLLQFIVEKGKSGGDAAQTAVWCVASKRPIGAIDDPELAKFTAELLGKTPPNYKIHYQPVEHVPGRPADLGKALLVDGNFTYTLDKDEVVRLVLLKGSGEFVKNISKEETMKAGEHRSSMHLEMYNLPAGKYILRMQTKAGKVIKDWEIEI